MRKWPGFVEKLTENDFGLNLHMYKFNGALIRVFPLGIFDSDIGEDAVALSRLDAHRAHTLQPSESPFSMELMLGILRTVENVQ